MLRRRVLNSGNTSVCLKGTFDTSGGSSNYYIHYNGVKYSLAQYVNTDGSFELTTEELDTLCNIGNAKNYGTEGLDFAIECTEKGLSFSGNTYIKTVDVFPIFLGERSIPENTSQLTTHYIKATKPFNGCTKLVSVGLERPFQYAYKYNGVNYGFCGYYLFGGCSNLANVNIVGLGTPGERLTQPPHSNGCFGACTNIGIKNLDMFVDSLTKYSYDWSKTKIKCVLPLPQALIQRLGTANIKAIQDRGYSITVQS